MTTYKQRNSEIYCGKTCVARIYVNHNGGNELRVLQGVPRGEVVSKIAADVPSFLPAYGIIAGARPALFSA